MSGFEDVLHDAKAKLHDALMQAQAAHAHFGDAEATRAQFDSRSPELAEAGWPRETLAGISAQLGGSDTHEFIGAALNGLQTPQVAAVDPGQVRDIGAAAGMQRLEPPRFAQHRLGDLSMAYETGMRPGREAQAAARVSTGKDDDGGVSYGAYQLASRKGQPQRFFQNEGAPWATAVNGMDPTVHGGPYGAAWKGVAAEDPAAFFDAQHAYIDRSHYRPAVGAVLNRTGVDLDGRADAVRDMAWSTAVQHDKAADLLTDAVNDVRRQMTPDDPGFDRALIDRLYSRRKAYAVPFGKTENVKTSLRNRYRNERLDALGMLPE